MEKVHVVVIGLPSFSDVVDKIKEAIEDKFDMPKFKKPCFCCDDEDEEDEIDFTPKRFKLNKSFGNTQPWGVGGKKADENLRFGAAFAIDEPRCQEYDSRWEFEDDHEAFDRFVEAGEDCVARGLARPEGVVEHKCGAIRQPIGCKPPMNKELIGETQWWCEDCDWEF